MLLSIARDGQEIGEWSEAEVRGLYTSGQLVGSDLFWCEGMVEWKPLRSLIKPALLPPAQEKAEPPTIEEPAKPVVIPAVTPPPLPAASPINAGQKRNWKIEGKGCLYLLLSVLAWAIGYGTITLWSKDDPLLVAQLAGGAVAGAVCGLVPFFIARARRHPRRPLYVWICVGAGAIGGIVMAIPTCLGLSLYLLLKRPK